jgi:hypothetical protein
VVTDPELLNVELFRGEIYGGKADIKGVVGLQRPSLSFTYSVANARLGELLQKSFGFNFVESGRFSTSGSFSNTGYSMSALIKSLEGAGSITARGVVVKGFNFVNLSRKIPQIKDIDTLKSITYKELSTGTTTLDYVSGAINFRHGLIYIEGMNFTNAVFRDSVLDGNFNLLNWTTEINSQVTLLTKGGTVPLTFQATGPIGNPVARWNSDAVEHFWERKAFGSGY